MQSWVVLHWIWANLASPPAAGKQEVDTHGDTPAETRRLWKTFFYLLVSLGCGYTERRHILYRRVPANTWSVEGLFYVRSVFFKTTWFIRLQDLNRLFATDERRFISGIQPQKVKGNIQAKGTGGRQDIFVHFVLIQVVTSNGLHGQWIEVHPEVGKKLQSLVHCVCFCFFVIKNWANNQLKTLKPLHFSDKISVSFFLQI